MSLQDYKKSIIGLFIATLVLAASAGGFFDVITRTKAAKSAATSKTQEYNDLSTKLNDLKMIDNQKENFENKRKTIDGYLPSTLNSSQFIISVENLAKEVGLTIDGISLADTSSKTQGSDKQSEKKSSLGENQFILSGVAPYEKVTQFTKEMEQLSRFNSLNSISLAAGEGSVNFKLQGVIYYGK